MFSIFDKYHGLFTAFSGKKDGSMKIPRNPEMMAKNSLNREKFLSRIGVSSDFLVSAEIAHGNKVELISKNNKGKIVSGADGLVTNGKNLFLSVTVADCLPVFLYDPKKKAIGIIHAGWRSLAKGILENAIIRFTDNFNSDPKDILAGIGPAICRQHYEIGPEVAEKFSEYPQALIEAKGNIFLDIKEVGRLQLTEQGLMRENVETSSECTFEFPDRYFSARRDKPEEIEAMIAVIGLKYRE